MEKNKIQDLYLTANLIHNRRFITSNPARIPISLVDTTSEAPKEKHSFLRKRGSIS